MYVNVCLTSQNSVPHLKTRLQLQQAIMKELIQRTLAEKKSVSSSGGTSTTPTPTTTPSSVTPSPPTSSTGATLDPSPLSQSIPVAVATSTVGGTVSTGQAVTAVKVGTVKNSSAATKPTTVPGSKVTLSNLNSLPAPSLATLEQLNQQLPQVLRDKIAKLPPEQQKFVYTHHLRQLHLKEQQFKQQQQANSQNLVNEKQQKLVQEQQVPLVLGVAKPGGAALRNTSATVSVGVGGTPEIKKSNFASMKIIQTTSSSSSVSVSVPPPPPPPGPKKKGKGKDGGGSQDAE